MRIQILTSCTGKKAVESEHALTLADFKNGTEVVRALEDEHQGLLMPAEELYTGQQHVKLMAGVREVRAAEPINLHLHVLSAGYGLVEGNRNVLPYEVTFATMKKTEITEWASFLNIPQDVRQLLATSYDLGLILLGDNYLEACQLNETVTLGGPTLLFCGTAVAKRLPKLENLKVVTLSNPEARRMSCGLVALKGELGARILNGVLTKGQNFVSDLMGHTSVLDLLEKPKLDKKPKKQPVINPEVDRIIELPEEWSNSPHKAKLRYFIPDWDDQVDPDFDFINETHSGGVGNWNNQVYAHQMYAAPNYDGILISRVVVDGNNKRKKLMESLGVHGSLRVPINLPIMGDCGAFGYLMEEKPPYSTENVLDYYTRYGFNLGVSVDHLIVNATMEQAKARYQMTINNAEEFLNEHKKQGLPWRPIGAVQGWDAKSYAAAAEHYVKMGYDYIALGGLVRTKTDEVLRIVEEVSKVVPRNVDVHLFGLARLEAMRTFSKLGVTSVDSASHLRRAWLGSTDNYWSMEGKRYAAIRIPQPGKKQVDEDTGRIPDQVVEMEKACLSMVRNYDKGLASLNDTLDVLEAYDKEVMKHKKKRINMRPHYEKTLLDKPWKQCPCDICKKEGVEVIIFRGNNRNRRRGFHNTYVFYHLLKNSLVDPLFYVDSAHAKFESEVIGKHEQLELFVPSS